MFIGLQSNARAQRATPSELEALRTDALSEGNDVGQKLS
jgi:hypothetical protein